MILLTPLKLMQEDSPGKHKNRVYNWKRPLNIGMILLSCFPGRRGYSRELLVGVSRPVLQILILFQTNKCRFLTLFQTWPQLFKSHSAIRWINVNPADNAIGFPNTYPLNSAIQLLNNRDLAFKKLFLHYLD